LLETIASADFHPWRIPKKPLPPTSSTPPIPSLESPPKLELKPLPDKLNYAFLGSNDTLPVIIASDLQKDQEDSMLAILNEHKETIGWTVADLKGSNPSICMHWIHLEEVTVLAKSQYERGSDEIGGQITRCRYHLPHFR
jgi:hypothetical protein